LGRHRRHRRMTAAFIPITDTWYAPDGLVALGGAGGHIDDVAPVDARSIFQKGGQQFACGVWRGGQKAGHLTLRALIVDPIAISKVKNRVYRGFSVVITAGGEIERIALVDSPSALGKAGGVRPAMLKLGKGIRMRNRYAVADKELAL